MTERLSDDLLLADNLHRVEEHIYDACVTAGRDPQEVRLLAVTKTVDAQRINTAIRLGVRQIGENRVQEFLRKRDALCLSGVDAHLIGHLQTNKVKQVVGKVQMIQSVDSMRVAEAIGRYSADLGIVTPILIEVNIGGEEAKSGVAPSELERLLYDICSLKGILVRGLMTVPPILHTEREKREIFSKMYQLFVDIKAKKLDNVCMQELSMGMSGDYREAILEGSTIVRVGSAIFGERHY